MKLLPGVPGQLFAWLKEMLANNYYYCVAASRGIDRSVRPVRQSCGKGSAVLPPEPGQQSIAQTGSRILKAKAVRLGKVIGARVLITKLVRCNSGNGVPVLALKSILPRCQQEKWKRSNG